MITNAQLALSIISLLASSFGLFYAIRTRYKIIEAYETQVSTLLELIAQYEDELLQKKN